MLPTATDSERALVSSLCHSPALFGALPQVFLPFYIEDITARTVFEAARKLWLENKPVSFDTVRLALGSCIDLVSLDMVWETVPSGANLSYYLEIVLTKARARACSRSASQFIANLQAENSLSTESLDTLISQHANELGQSWGYDQELPTIQSQVVDFNEWISSASDSARSSVRFGLEKLDDILGSIQPGDLIVVGGGTGQGKSALALQAAHNSLPQMRVCYFSLEMPARQLVGRLVANKSGVPLSRILKGKVTASELDRISEASEEVAHLPLRILDGNSCNPENIRSTLKRLAILEEPVGLCIVDYLQLLKAPARSGPEERREAVVAEFARSLKETAVAEGVVMMVLSQLNDDGRLRESRAIGQHADVVVLISQTGDDSILRIEKHRNGPCGAAVARFCGERFCFEPKQASKSASDRVRH